MGRLLSVVLECEGLLTASVRPEELRSFEVCEDGAAEEPQTGGRGPGRVVEPVPDQVGGVQPALGSERDAGGPGEVSTTQRQVVRRVGGKPLAGHLRQLTVETRVREEDLCRAGSSGLVTSRDHQTLELRGRAGGCQGLATLGRPGVTGGAGGLGLITGGQEDAGEGQEV